MYQYLFFDDQKLFRRNNLTRNIVSPQLIADSVFCDGISSTDLRTPFIFKTDDGKYRMIYQGRLPDGKDSAFLAISDDGIRFTPEDVTDRITIEDRVADHEIFKIPCGEIAEIIEDPYNDPAERYKMLYCDNSDGENLVVHGYVYTSADLIHWNKIEGVEWNDGAEPITGVFYNQQRQCHTIMVRPDWGTRKVGYVDTKDWRTFTPYEISLQCDSLDDPLVEIYGMPAMAYGNYYIGFPLIYGNFEDALAAKFSSGTMECELAYSLDGHHWQRSLRDRFITGLDEQSEQVFGYQNKMVWPACFCTQENGDVLIFCAITKHQHGYAFANPGAGKICAYRVKKDRFIALTAQGEGLLATRENIWNSGEVHINLSCAKATLAVYESQNGDLFGSGHAIEGYSHEDCIPFSGDSTDWVPQFKNGKKLDDLRGKTLILEVKMTDGSIYSISGEFRPVMNLQGARYRVKGIAPTKEI